MNEDQDNIKLWETMFGGSYLETSSQEIGKIVESICKRMFLFKTYEPFFTRRLFKMLIEHPNFSVVDRNVYKINKLSQILASYVEIFKVDFKFTSKDVLSIAQSALERQTKGINLQLIIIRLNIKPCGFELSLPGKVVDLIAVNKEMNIV